MTLSFVARPRASSVLPLAMFFGSFSWSFAFLTSVRLRVVPAPRLAELVPERRLLAALLLESSTALAARARSTWPYGIVRFVQMLVVAPVFPIGVAGVPLVVGRLTEAVR